MPKTMAPKKKKQPAGSWALRLQKLRERLDLPVAEMADGFGVSVNTLTAWLYGTRSPSGPAQKLIELYEQTKK